jgi:tRNA threonylcarbamoyladenosine modification (KEOPS) complex  Pcc1 subunit
MSPAKISFKVYQGSTFTEVLRWESSKKVYKPITGITNAAPTVVTATDHGVPDGWRIKITNVGGMTDINSAEVYHQATKVDTNTIELNAVNSLGYKVYTSGGVVEYNEPIDLTGYTARMQIREKVDSTTTIKELTTENGGITLDITNSKITVTISATDTAAFTFASAVYSLELVSSTNVVTPLINGNISLVREVTR